MTEDDKDVFQPVIQAADAEILVHRNWAQLKGGCGEISEDSEIKETQPALTPTRSNCQRERKPILFVDIDLFT